VKERGDRFGIEQLVGIASSEPQSVLVGEAIKMVTVNRNRHAVSSGFARSYKLKRHPERICATGMPVRDIRRASGCEA
jgi:hypothetical protein